MKTINLIVGFTPYHSLYVESFLDDIEGEKYCFFTKRYPNKAFNKIGFYGWPIFSFFIYSVLVRYWFFFGYKINFYFPHACHLTTNYLVFSGRCETLNVYEEGIANYYDANREAWNLKFLKKLLGCFLFLPYKKYKGHITGCDGRVFTSCIASRPENLVCKDNFKNIVKKSIKLAIKDHKHFENKILFIDQPLNIDARCKENIVNDWLKQVLPKYEVYYKPHHECNYSFDGMLRLSNKQDGLPVELLISMNFFPLVVSFYSSALVNVSSIYEGVNARYIKAGEEVIKVNGVSMSIYLFLESSGIQQFEVPS